MLFKTMHLILNFPVLLSSFEYRNSYNILALWSKEQLMGSRKKEEDAIINYQD